MLRDKTLDSIKGIAIMLVIIGHLISDFNSFGLKLIYSFHMPLFFMISGVFCKQGNIKKDFVNVVIPFFSINFIILVLRATTANEWSLSDSLLSFVWSGGGAGNSRLFGFIKNIGTSWFLITLFWAKVIYRIFEKKNLYIKIITSIWLFLLGSYISRVVNTPACLGQSFIALFFIFIGSALYEKLKLLKVIAIFPLLMVWGILLFYNDRLINYNSGDIGNPVLAIISAITASSALYLLVQYFNFKKIKPLVWCGKNSLYIFCSHCIILQLASLYLKRGEITYTILVIVLSIVLAPISKQYLTFVKGKLA